MNKDIDIFEDDLNTEEIDTDNDTEFVYSVDEETFYDDIDEVMDMVNDNMDNEPGDRVIIYRGTPVPIKHIDYVKKLDLIGMLQDIAHEEDGEISEDYLSRVTEEDVDIIFIYLAKILDRMASQPDHYRVENVQPMTVTVCDIE